MNKMLRTRDQRDKFVAGCIVALDLIVVVILGVVLLGARWYMMPLISLGIVAVVGGLMFVGIKATRWIDRGEEQ